MCISFSLNHMFHVFCSTQRLKPWNQTVMIKLYTKQRISTKSPLDRSRQRVTPFCWCFETSDTEHQPPPSAMRWIHLKAIPENFHNNAKNWWDWALKSASGLLNGLLQTNMHRVLNSLFSRAYFHFESPSPLSSMKWFEYLPMFCVKQLVPYQMSCFNG